MSDENDSTSSSAAETETTDGAAADRAPDSDAPKKNRTDEDGLPLDRAATFDDVRETHGVHGRYALGCTILIVATIVAFWLIRGGLGG